MEALTQQLMKYLSGDGLSQISKQIGTDEGTTGSVLSAAMPLLVSALARNAAKPDGATSLQQALVKDHDGSILSNMQGYLSDPQAANGAGILDHVLGDQQPVVTQGLAKSTGLDSNKIGQLPQIAAPLIMGLLGKQQQQEGFDTNSLSSFLGSQQQQEQQSNPDLMGVLNNLLDADSDGSALDAILGMAGKFLGGK